MFPTKLSPKVHTFNYPLWDCQLKLQEKSNARKKVSRQLSRVQWDPFFWKPLRKRLQKVHNYKGRQVAKNEIDLWPIKNNLTWLQSVGGTKQEDVNLFQWEEGYQKLDSKVVRPERSRTCLRWTERSGHFGKKKCRTNQPMMIGVDFIKVTLRRPFHIPFYYFTRPNWNTYIRIHALYWMTKVIWIFFTWEFRNLARAAHVDRSWERPNVRPQQPHMLEGAYRLHVQECCCTLPMPEHHFTPGEAIPFE